jgi:rhomboid family GlyGly-CTERM serine protease
MSLVREKRIFMKAFALPLQPNQYLPYLCVGIIATVLSLLIFGGLREWLIFDPTRISTDAYTLLQTTATLFTRHFVHTNTVHLLVNLVGLSLIWMLYGDYFTPKQAVQKFSLLFLSLCFSSSFLTWWLSDSDAGFIGLSGVLHALFAWGVVQDIRLKIKTGYLLLLGLLLKIGQEQFYENSGFMANMINAEVAVDAHLYGALAGLVFGFIIKSEVKK